jgi:hypothetical protein
VRGEGAETILEARRSATRCKVGRPRGAELDADSRHVLAPRAPRNAALRALSRNHDGVTA